MLLPHYKLVETLIVLRYNLKTLNAFLEKFNFRLIASSDYSTISSKILTDFPEIFKGDNDYLFRSLQTLNITGMYAYLKNDTLLISHEDYSLDLYKEAFNIWEDLTSSRPLRTMAMAKVSPEEAELYINQVPGKALSTEACEVFFNFFFNVFDWTLGDKKVYIEEEPDKTLKNLFKLALTKDKEYVIWKSGLSPNKSYTDMLDSMLTDAYFQYRDTPKVKTEDAKKWADIFLKVGDKLKDQQEVEGKGEDGAHKLLLEIKAKSPTTIISFEDIDVEKPDPGKFVGRKEE